MKTFTQKLIDNASLILFIAAALTIITLGIRCIIVANSLTYNI